MTLTIIDYGGTLGAHIAAGKYYAAHGVMLKIVYCASACLMMLLQVPKDQVCFYPQAWIGYHSVAQHPTAQGICCEESTTTMRWQRGTDWIARGYAGC